MNGLSLASVALFIAVVICGTVTCFAGWSEFTVHAKKLLLLSEYALVLPALLLFCRKRGGSCNQITHQDYSRPLVPLVLLYLIVTMPMACVLGFGIYQSDESAYLFQARCVRAGQLWLPVPAVESPHSIAFANHVISGGKWFGKYPFGWPLVLSIAVGSRLEWLLNPLLGALLLVLTYCIGRRALCRKVAVYGSIIFVLSALFTVNCIGYMSHVLCAVLLASATLCYVRASHSRNQLAWLTAMICLMGASALVRPFTALCAGAVLVAAVLCNRHGDLAFLVRFCAIASVAVLVVVLTTLQMNQVLTGSYWTSPYALDTSHAPELSFRKSDIVSNLLHQTPIRLADTAAVSFPFFFPLALAGLWHQRRNPTAWLLLSLFAALVLGYAMHMDDSDSPIGERFYFETFFAMALLAGSGSKVWWEWLRSGWRARYAGMLLTALALIVTILSLHWEYTLRWPLTQVAAAAESATGTVFLVSGGRYQAVKYNLNTPAAKAVFLIAPDKGSDPRQGTVLSYDGVAGRVVWTRKAEPDNSQK